MLASMAESETTNLKKQQILAKRLLTLWARQFLNHPYPYPSAGVQIIGYQGNTRSLATLKEVKLMIPYGKKKNSRPLCNEYPLNLSLF